MSSRLLSWRRTVIAGRPSPDDYWAPDPWTGGHAVRIYASLTPRPCWHWNAARRVQLGSGYAESVSEAAYLAACTEAEVEELRA